MSKDNNNPPNELNITADGISLHVKGDDLFIHQTYKAMRSLLMERFVAAQHQKPQPPPIPKAAIDPQVLQPDPTFAQVTPSSTYAWLCVCHDYYHKIHIVDRDVLARSPLAKIIDPSRLFKVFAERKHREPLTKLIGPSRELWSELTPEGQRKLGGAGGGLLK